MKKEEETIIAKTAEYISWDPNKDTKRIVQNLLDDSRYDELHEIMDNRLAFGTAGLRGQMGPGYSRINDLVVLQTAQGFCKHIIEKYGEEGKKRGIILGYDHRALGSLSSKGFAEITKKVFMKQGVTVRTFDSFVHTPMVPFGVTEYKTCGGIMVTASHNPGQDNGYKIYAENGCQIVSPADKEIMGCIMKNLEPWDHYDEMLEDNTLEINITDECTQKYFERVTSRLCFTPDMNLKCPRVVYTAMHGVGYPFVKHLVEDFKCPPVIPVESQIHPDPTFPTVAFPNPEEKGALDLAIAFAETQGVKLVMATDPDADRFNCAERGADGNWHVLTGDEIGFIFAYFMSKFTQGAYDKRCIVSSVVSGQLLRRMSEVEGIHFEQGLTGFKWLGNIQLRLKNEGFYPLIAYEEAIGYCLGDVIFDKDGVSALAVMLQIVSDLYSRGSTLMDTIEEMYQKYGYFLSRNHYVITPNESFTKSVFERLRNNGKYWFKMGNYPIKHIRDLTTGFDSEHPETNYSPVLPVSKSTEMITYTFMNGATLTIRTSGTEPKIKYYLEYSNSVYAEADRTVDLMKKAMLQDVFEISP